VIAALSVKNSNFSRRKAHGYMAFDKKNMTYGSLGTLKSRYFFSVESKKGPEDI
jgi:hypothetical protein